MATGDLITGDWEVEYQGLLLGGDTVYSLKEINGLLDLPDISSSDQARLQVHGGHPGDDWLMGRSIRLVFELYGTNELLFRYSIKNLLTAFRPAQGEAPLVFQIPSLADGSKIRVYARPRKRSWPITFEHYHRNPTVEIELYCTDPRIYSNGLSTDQAPLASSGGGLTFDATADFSFGTTSTGGGFTATNSGTFDTPVVFRVDGPVTNPRILHTGLDKEIRLNLTVPSGDFVVIDTASRTVLLNGTASRYSAVTFDSEFFNLEPGSNPISFRAATQTGGYLSASWRSAWV